MYFGFLAHLITMTLIYLVMASSFLGLGWATSKILGFKFSVAENPFIFLWLGWAMVLFFLQLLNLILPIAAFVSITIFVIGTITFFMYINREFRSVKEVVFRRAYLILISIAAFWIATRAMFSPVHYDGGLYYFNSIRWLNEFPIVFGLGNLHGRLAFNSSFFSYVASLNLYPVFNHGYNLANSFLLLTLLAECCFYFVNCVSIKVKENHALPVDRIPIFYIPVLIYMATTNISSPSTDTASTILQLLIFLHFIRDIDDNLSAQNDNSRMVFVFVMSITAITIKLSNLFFVFTVCLVLLLIRMKDWHLSIKHTFLKLPKWFFLPALLFFVWSLRGYFISGCPAYPSTIGCIHTRWAVPIESVKSEASWIFSWARQPNQLPEQVLTSWKWFKPWLMGNIQSYSLSAVYPFVIFVLCLLLSLWIYIRNPMSRKFYKEIALIPIPILTALLFWFFLAPDFRFSHALFWILPISMVIYLIKVFETSRRIQNAVIVILLILLNANHGLIFLINYEQLLTIPTTGFMPIPVAELTSKRTLSNLEVYSPVHGDQCWDSRLPCTPYFNEKLDFKEDGARFEFYLKEN